MNIGTKPQGSFDAVDAMMGILSDDEREAGDNQANEDDEEVAGDELDDESDDSEESSDDDEPQDEEAPKGKIYKVKIDGEELEVPEDELVKGYSRTQDYTRKTQALAEQRRQAEAEFEQVRQERAQYAHMLQQLAAKLDDEPQVDESLMYTDPIAYAQQVSNAVKAKQMKEAAINEQRRVYAMQQAEQQEQTLKYLESQAELVTTLIPEWVDDGTAKAEKAKIREMAKQYGYSDDELKGLYDARAVALMRDAMKYRDLVAKRQTVKPKNGPVLNSRPRNVQSGVANAQKRLQKTGSVQDAAEIFKSML